MRRNNWTPKGGEKGPKTIEEVREDVEKEQQLNEMERMEYEKREKEKDRLQPSRKPSRQNYGGRSSQDRRAAAVSKLALNFKISV